MVWKPPGKFLKMMIADLGEADLGDHEIKVFPVILLVFQDRQAQL